MISPALTVWRLSEGGETSLGLSCTKDGLFLGRTTLLDQEGGLYAVRSQQELERLLSAAYGFDVSLESRMGGLRTVAKAMSNDDLALATIAAVMLRLPDLPHAAARLALEAEDRLVKLEKRSSWAKIASPFDPDKHPRWPRGQSDGGEFRPAGGGANDNSSTQLISDTNPRGIGDNGGPPLEKPPEFQSRNQSRRHAMLS